MARHSEEIISENDFGSDLGAVLGTLLESKSILDAILKALAKRSFIRYSSELAFGLHLKGF